MIAIREWAERLGVKPPSISWHIKQYEKKGGEYNPYDINAILDFHLYLLTVIRDRAMMRLDPLKTAE